VLNAFFCLLLLLGVAQDPPPDAVEAFQKGESLIGTPQEFSDQQVEFFLKATELFPAFDAAQYNLAVVYRHRGELEKALTHARKLIEINPSDDRGYGFTGRLLLEMNRPVEAAPVLEKAVQLAPDNDYYWSDLADLYYRNEQFEKAVDALQHVLELKPLATEVYFNIALAQQNLGQTGKAINSYQKFLASEPGNFRGHFNLGLLYQKQGDRENALEQFLLAERMEPDNPDLAQALGNLYLDQGQLESARARLERAGGDRPQNLANLGVVAKRAGRPREAPRC